MNGAQDEPRAESRDAETPRRRDALTDRETQILTLVAHGWSDKAIARELELSRRTVSNGVGIILLKLGAQNRTKPPSTRWRAAGFRYAPSLPYAYG